MCMCARDDRPPMRGASPRIVIWKSKVGHDPSWGPILGIHPGDPSWGSILGIHPGDPSWGSILGINPGDPSWGSILVIHPGDPSWGSILGIHPGDPNNKTSKQVRKGGYAIINSKN